MIYKLLPLLQSAPLRRAWFSPVRAFSAPEVVPLLFTHSLNQLLTFITVTCKTQYLISCNYLNSKCVLKWRKLITWIKLVFYDNFNQHSLGFFQKLANLVVYDPGFPSC